MKWLGGTSGRYRIYLCNVSCVYPGGVLSRWAWLPENLFCGWLSDGDGGMACIRLLRTFRPASELLSTATLLRCDYPDYNPFSDLASRDCWRLLTTVGARWPFEQDFIHKNIVDISN